MRRITHTLINTLKPILSRQFPAASFIFIPINSLKIGNFFRCKDTIPKDLRSSVVYLYKCASCNTRYVGQTGLQLQIRIAKHKGISHRTDLPLTSPEFSSIRNHAHHMDHAITNDSFSSLSSVPESYDRKIMESLFIYSLRPELNSDQSSVRLNLF